MSQLYFMAKFQARFAKQVRPVVTELSEWARLKRSRDTLEDTAVSLERERVLVGVSVA